VLVWAQLPVRLLGEIREARSEAPPVVRFLERLSVQHQRLAKTEINAGIGVTTALSTLHAVRADISA
jgi:hypothetical protein